MPGRSLAAGKKKGRATPWHPPKSRLLIAENDDGATPNYDQSGGPSNLDAPLQWLHQPPGLRAWAEDDPAEHHQFDVHARLLLKAWTPTSCYHAAVGENRCVSISKMGTDPLSPEVGGDACQQACHEPDEANLLFQQNTGGT